MGTSLSFDKYPTPLEVLLGTPPTSFSKVAAQYHDQGLGHLLRVWRVSQDAALTEELNFLDADLRFSRVDSYLALLLRSPLHQADTFSVPEELKAAVDSLDNLNNLARAHSRGDHNTVLFLWHGKAASAVVRAEGLVKAFELEDWLKRDCGDAVKVMLGGGRVVGAKVKKGEIVALKRLLKSSEAGADIYSTPARDLLKWLKDPPKQLRFPHYFLYLQSHPDPGYFPLDPLPKSGLKPASKPAFSLNLSTTVSREEERKHISAKPNLSLAEIEEDDDIRYTNRAQMKLEMFSTAISELYPGLFVAGDIIARDKALLKSKGVTHIVNCAGNVCGNYHPEDFHYLSYFLKDSNTENIECVFYESTQFIDSALAAGGKVLVHCHQGVSRSVTVSLAYLIFKERKSFDSVFKEAREKRGICSPNFGFQVQLMWWHKRLEGDSESLPFPRVFAVGSHESETPRKLVVRMLRTLPYSQGPEACRLDPRGVFLVHTPEALYVWEGNSVPVANVSAYRAAIEEEIRLLQTYERAPSAVLRYVQGTEDQAFWESLKQASVPAEPYREETAWNNWYTSLDVAQDQEPHPLAGDLSEPLHDERPTLYVYPEVTGLTVFDDEELQDDALVSLCRGSLQYVWRGSEFSASDAEDFTRGVRLKHWGDRAEQCSSTLKESQGRESEEFLSFF